MATDVFESHIKRMAEIQQQGMEFFKRVSEHHIEIVERKIDANLQVAKKLFGEDDETASKEGSS